MASKSVTLAVVTTNELVQLDSKLAFGGSRTALAAPLAVCADNAAVLVASSRGVAKYGRESNAHIFGFESVDDGTVTPIAASGSTVCVARNNVVLVYSPNSPEPAHTLDAHTSSISSLALSASGNMLASASNTVHIYDLSTMSRTVLRGLPASGQVSRVAFHPVRGAFFYDVSRPDSPLRTALVGSNAHGDIVSIDCSLHSSLIAASCSRGLIAIFDLEKEKLLVKTTDTKASLTCLRFHPGSPHLVVGTRDGRVLSYDLRAWERDPQSVIIDKRGAPVLALDWLQNQNKGPMKTSTKATAHAAKSTASVRAVTTKQSTKPTSTPAGILSSRAAVHGVFSPARRPAAERETPAEKKLAMEAATRQAARASKENIPVPSPSISPSTTRTARKLMPRDASRRAAVSPDILSKRRVSITASSCESNSPCPSLPSTSHISPPGKRAQRQALGLGTPARARPGSSGTMVSDDVASSASPLSASEFLPDPDHENLDHEVDEPTAILPRQHRTGSRGPSTESIAESISTSDAIFAENHFSASYKPHTPLSGEMSPTKAFASMGQSSPTALRAFMQDIATKDDIKGLHMDIIRMTAAWRSEIRNLAHQFGSEMSNLREENTQLRGELQRLRSRT
ncbi:WD40 repeat-like protein [Auriculariales sp. MPI-PUGE-AT-0066]|nr:WD40 repeat-like protein [Auriculariales sp. MPI-PUGE-AT-0066]